VCHFVINPQLYLVSGIHFRFEEKMDRYPPKKEIVFTMQSILQAHLNTAATGGQHGSHYIYWVSLSVFNALPTVSWKFNRPPDPERVEEIRTCMKESKRVDGLIYLACIQNQLVCYESNHRRMALKEGMPSEMATILVDMIWDATDDQVKAEFFRLNKAISVPDLFVENASEESVSVVLAAVEVFCKKYDRLKSPSGRPQRPNYNRDVFMNDIVRLMKELRIGVDELMSRLDKRNTILAGQDHSKLSQNVRQKCESSGLWLFAVSGTLNAKDLE
jgi:hypothetical protein